MFIVRTGSISKFLRVRGLSLLRLNGSISKFLKVRGLDLLRLTRSTSQVWVLLLPPGSAIPALG